MSIKTNSENFRRDPSIDKKIPIDIEAFTGLTRAQLFVKLTDNPSNNFFRTTFAASEFPTGGSTSIQYGCYVFKNTTTAGTIVAIDSSTGEIFKSSLVSGTWQDWEKLSVPPDEVTITENSSGNLELKNLGHDATKLAAVTIGTGLEKSTDGKTINHKNKITAQTNSKLYASTIDAEGHHSGEQTGYDVRDSLPTTTSNTEVFTGKLIDDTYQKKVKTVTATLTTAGWNTSHQQTLTITGVTTTSVVFVSESESATLQQLTNSAVAMIKAEITAANTMRFTALSGVHPSVNIPINVSILV